MTSPSPAESDIPEWEIEEGLPQPTDQFIQQYLQGREALIEQESSQRSDYAFRQSLSPLAAEACAIVSRIRAEELRTVWTGASEDDFAEQKGVSLYPGMMFTLAKGKMKNTKLWQIVHGMPKGALLHAHFDAMLDVDWLIEQMLATEGMTMHASQALPTAEAREKSEILFKHVQTSTPQKTSIWSQDYEPSDLVPVNQAAEEFPGSGIEGFKHWLKDRCTITQEESLGHYHGVHTVWKKFASCFPIINSLFHYEPILRAATQRMLRQLMDDGIRWAEFRRYAPGNRHEKFFKLFSEELADFQATDQGKNFWGCRFIWTTLRFVGKREVVDSMKMCIDAKKMFPDLIAGYDLVGFEDQGRPLADLTPELFWFRKRCVEEDVNIPFVFHAGECLGDGDETDQNLFDAILLGTRRIGHGFSLYKHPLLIEMVKQKKILIESCPISNEVLRLTNSIKSHPLPALLARGVSCALSNDDPALLGHDGNGLTQDFWQALQGWENLGLEGLGSLAENSVRYALYGPDQTPKEWMKDVSDGINGDGLRASRMREWTTEWNAFCENIIVDYAADYGSDDEGGLIL